MEGGFDLNLSAFDLFVMIIRYPASAERLVVLEIVRVLQVSLTAFAFLFSELVQYNQTQVDNIAELERR